MNNIAYTVYQTLDWNLAGQLAPALVFFGVTALLLWLGRDEKRVVRQYMQGVPVIVFIVSLVSLKFFLADMTLSNGLALVLNYFFMALVYPLITATVLVHLWNFIMAILRERKV